MKINSWILSSLSKVEGNCERIKMSENITHWHFTYNPIIFEFLLSGILIDIKKKEIMINLLCQELWWNLCVHDFHHHHLHEKEQCELCICKNYSFTVGIHQNSFEHWLSN
jgi:hypothetical protein